MAENTLGYGNIGGRHYPEGHKSAAIADDKNKIVYQRLLNPWHPGYIRDSNELAIMDLLNLSEHIRIMEELLLHQDFSTSPEQLESMLDRNFREINPRGEEISREAVISWLLGKDTSLRWEFSEFEVTALSDDLVLATYFAHQVYPEGASSGGARHSSIWRENRTGKMWQLVFHQSTKTA